MTASGLIAHRISNVCIICLCHSICILDDNMHVLLVFPTNHKKNSTVRILKTPKTESSVRKIFLPKSVANMLVDWKAEQDEMKEILDDDRRKNAELFEEAFYEKKNLSPSNLLKSPSFSIKMMEINSK